MDGVGGWVLCDVLLDAAIDDLRLSSFLYKIMHRMENGRMAAWFWISGRRTVHR